MITVIIPTYNASATIVRVLDAFYRQKGIKKDEFEVLVVDDCSTDNTVSLVKKYPLRFEVLNKNSGSAMARNRGVKEAKGDLIVFVDSDVILKDDVLAKIRKKFADYPSIGGLTGIYAKCAANPSPFRSYLALRKYSNWLDVKHEFVRFWPVYLGAIKKDIFLEFGGFNTKYRGADVEDFELGYRISDKYKILRAYDIQGYHHFPNFGKTVRNFFKRSFQWMELFTKRKKFSSEGATTRKGGVATLAGFASLVMFISCFWYPALFVLASLAFVAFILGNINFYNFVLKERGILFLIYSLILNYIFSAVIGTAAVLSILNQCRLRVIKE